MAEDKKIIVLGDATKDTTMSAGDCASCAGYAGVPTPFVFTPVNFTYNIKAKYIHAKGGSENTLALTPNKDIYAEFNLMQINTIVKGAVGKDAAQELMDYYNGALAQGGGPAMTKDFAEKVITEFHTELSKPKWKTFFEKCIKNSLKTENLLKDTFQDYINHDFITNHNRKAASYEGWGKSSCEKTYSVKVNLGVKPKFLKTCSLENDNSRLKVVSPTKKFCKAFLALTGEEKEVSDDNFLFEVTDKYSEASPRSFTSSSTLGKIEDLNEKLITPSSMAQSAQDYDKLVRDGAFAGFQGAGNGGGGPFQFDSETRAVSLGIQHGGTRIQVESDMSGNQAIQDIYFRVELGIGPDGDVGVTKVAIGGRKASLGYALQQIARNMQGWMYQVWQSWHKPNDPEPLKEVEKAEEKAEEVLDKSGESVDKTGASQDAVTDVAGAVANVTPETAAAVAQQVASAKAAAADANAAAIATQTAQTALATGTVASNTNNGNVAKLATQTGQVMQHLDTVAENLGVVPPNIPNAQTAMTAAVTKSAEASATAAVVETKATEVKQDASGLVSVVKKLTEIAGNGNDLPPGEKSMLNSFGAKVEEAKTVVKTITADNNKTVPGDLLDNLGGTLVPEGSNNATIPKTSTGKSDLEADSRVKSNDNTKGESSFIFKGSATETPNPISTIGSNEGDGFKSNNNPGWKSAVEDGTLEFIIEKKGTDHPAQNGKMSE